MKLRNRATALWWVLRGRPVMYRVTIDARQLLGQDLFVAECRFYTDNGEPLDGAGVPLREFEGFKASNADSTNGGQG